METTWEPTTAQMTIRDSWNSAVPLLNRLLVATTELDESCTLADALSGNLGKVASALGMVDSLSDIKITDLTNELTVPEEVLLALTELQESLLPLEQQILERRILTSEPITLEELGKEFDLSRERIRQRQARLESNIRHPSAGGAASLCWIGIISAGIRQRIGPVATERELEKQISAAFPITSHNDESVIRMGRCLLREDLNYAIEGNIYIDEAAIETVQTLKEEANSLADQTGFVDELELRGHIPHENLDQYWEALLEATGLYRLYGQLCLRDSPRTRTKAALLFIGRSATKNEISEICGVPPERVGSYLSNFSDVVRAGKTHWGLTEWVEDEYEGIPAEIIQRINEDGGVTRLERLLEELPRLFDVSEGSVRSYANSPQFQVSDGYVSLADPSLVTLRTLDDVIHGRTADGLPFWGFKVESRYFDGYSLAGLPPEIAKALGCEPNDRVRIPVSAPEGCGPVSVRWSLTSLTGASLGYLSAPLDKLMAQEGEQILLVLEASGNVSFHRDSPQLRGTPTTTPYTGESQTPDRAKDLLERMKNRRRGL